MAAPAAPPADFADSASAAASSSSSPNTEPTLPATVFDPDTLVKRGWCTVATDKSRAANPHKLYYGQPPARTCSQFGHRELLTLRSLLQNCMDKMNRRADAWYEQVDYFARLPGYAVLVFDNRGVGWSDSPGWSYTTREMALDVVELLDFLGWTQDRSLNVVGALLIPERIHALLLTSTRSGSKTDLPSYAALNMFARLTSGTVRSPEKQIRLVVNTLYPQAYLDEIVQAEGEWKGKTQRDRIEAGFLHRYHIGRRQSFAGRVAEEARQISSTIPRIAIIHGTEDKLLHVDRGRDLHAELPCSTLKIVENAGHALPSQIRDEYHDWIRENVEATT
ncbi:hypothetical protein C6P46_004804 [Rhodotorula mucilaginosa]|uniref:AB hydrolase-1 domain-containing protein n=1 Tax=Rhodotorula mucilaginosa TaxID=5537 RepID=A0A9P6W1R5_RHOMI|nr:hypothetical protein C6P46_004804 [Rhodotorula mucilaginosa]